MSYFRWGEAGFGVLKILGEIVPELLKFSFTDNLPYDGESAICEKTHRKFRDI